MGRIITPVRISASCDILVALLLTNLGRVHYADRLVLWGKDLFA